MKIVALSSNAHSGSAAVLSRSENQLIPLTADWDDLWRCGSRAAVRQLIKKSLNPKAKLPLVQAQKYIIAPFVGDGVIAAGVTYKRSEAGRREESSTPDIYTRVYQAASAKNPEDRRPELFHKAPHRKYVTGPGQSIRIRKDSRWNVPEPELALVVNPKKKILGYTICDDMSSRDIEGANPLYLPQAKTYLECCGLGPWVYVPDSDAPLGPRTAIELKVFRGRACVWSGKTDVSHLARTPEDLVNWLFRDECFSDGIILSTGTGIVPQSGSSFSLLPADRVWIKISAIGVLEQVVVQG